MIPIDQGGGGVYPLFRNRNRATAPSKILSTASQKIFFQPKSTGPRKAATTRTPKKSYPGLLPSFVFSVPLCLCASVVKAFFPRDMLPRFVAAGETHDFLAP